MPDITVSFTDAQWTRMVAASSVIKMATRESGVIDADYLVSVWKTEIERQVKRYEESLLSTDAF